MVLTRLVDFRSVVFGFIGITFAAIVIALHLSWLWFWIPLAAVLVARVVLGRAVRALEFCICALAPGVVMASYLVAMPVLEDWWHREPFDPKAWKQIAEPKDIMWPARLRMVDDLLNRNDLHGRDRPKVIELLGEPDATRWDRENQLVYELGPERG